METNTYIYYFTPKREDFLMSMTDEEKMAFYGHANYTSDLFGNGKIILMGACTDGALGTVIFKAENMEEAMQIYMNDPAVKAGIVNSSLHPFKVTGVKI